MSGMTSGQPLVRLESATVRFGGVVALRELSLTLQRGERLALVGANGSGKTTLLRLLHGLVEPAEGQCTRLDLQPEGRPATGAMLFQRPFLLHLSALRNVSLGLWLRGWPRAQRAEASLRALQRVGLGPLARRPAHELSGGQQQRLALARAWAQRPDILFLDEPTASLDPSAKREVETLIEEFAAEGMTVVLATHNLGQTKRLASRVAYLEGGRLVVERLVHEFFTEALPTQAALFLKGEMAWV